MSSSKGNISRVALSFVVGCGGPQNGPASDIAGRRGVPGVTNPGPLPADASARGGVRFGPGEDSEPPARLAAAGVPNPGEDTPADQVPHPRTTATDPAAANGSGAELPSQSANLPSVKNSTVLHIGDSFVFAGFSQALGPRVKELGARYHVLSETSSFTVTWAKDVDRILAKTQPSLVIITLGANEVLNTKPETHAHAVRRIVAAMGKRPCVWVSPPLWRKDTGIVDVIRQNSAPCRFFDSDKMVAVPIARQKDQIHPNAEGGAIWARAFWDWLANERQTVAEWRGGDSPWRLREAPPLEHGARVSQPFSGGQAEP